MAFIRTVLGDIDPSEFGVCDSHEHMFRSGGPEVDHDKDFRLDDLDASIAETEDWLGAGGKSMVLMDPIGCGRNVEKTVALAEAFRGRAHFVTTTGFQKGDFYDHKVSFAATNSVEDLVEQMALEVNEGLDLHSYNGPIVKRVPYKAGVIKAGTGYSFISAFEQKTLTVAAKTQLRTGVPISIHTQQGTMGLEAAKFLIDQGAVPGHTVVCHSQKNPDRFYHKQILETGVYVCYDGPDRAKYFPDSVHADNLKWLIEQGFQKQLLLSMDAGRASYQKAHMAKVGKMANGISYLLERFVPTLLEAGISQEAVDDMLIYNPAKAFSFVEAGA